MLDRTSPWLTLAQRALFITTLLAACSDGEQTPGPADETLPAVTSTHGTALRLRDGTEIVPASLQCKYRQDTGTSKNLSLQLQYLAGPNRVAFAVYLENPVPAAPFVATPDMVDRFTFEAFVDGASGYRSDLESSEVTVHLDELPAPSSLRSGAAVRLHGRLEVSAFSLPAQSGEAESALELAASSVAIDCEAAFQESQVLD